MAMRVEVIALNLEKLMFFRDYPSWLRQQKPQ